MAVASGIAVANLYYIQPLLADIGRAFGASPPAMGVIVMLGQIGFAIGVLLFVPLGDISDRRRMILLMLTGAAISLMAVAMATSYLLLAAAIFFVGLFSVSPQMFVPFAAHLAAPERRGRAVGIGDERPGDRHPGLPGGERLRREHLRLAHDVLDGERPDAGTGDRLGALAAAQHRPASACPTGGCSLSMWQLIRSEPILRESALAAAMLFGAFSAFWSMLAFRLETPPLHYGSQVAGLFGIVGIAGAAAAPIAGRLADRLNPRVNVRVALFATVVAFLMLAVSGHTIAGLVAGIIVLDAGVQAGHVTNQSRIFNLLPEARNRLNTVYMVSFFLGGAAGSVLAANAWQRWGWTGVCAVGVAMPLVAAISLSLPEG